jgi:hypothetical protein
MVSIRRENGFISVDHLKYVNASHYKRARNATDLYLEEYWYQSVMHGPHYARSLTREVFQKQRRNGCTNTVEINTLVNTLDTTIANEVKAH